MFSFLAAVVVHIAIAAAALQALPHRTLDSTDEHGHTAQYSGVTLRDVLTQGGIPAGEALHGKALTRYVIVSAQDGYRMVFSLPELDAAFTDRVVLLADMREKREARWVRQVTAVDVEEIPPDAN